MTLFYVFLLFSSSNFYIILMFGNLSLLRIVFFLLKISLVNFLQSVGFISCFLSNDIV